MQSLFQGGSRSKRPCQQPEQTPASKKAAPRFYGDTSMTHNCCSLLQRRGSFVLGGLRLLSMQTPAPARACGRVLFLGWWGGRL